MATDDSKQQEYWEQEHGHRHFDHPVVSSFARQRVAYIQQFLDLGNIRTALDVGCGSGFSTYYVHEYIPNVWGADRSQAMLNIHPLRKQGRLVMMDAFHLPFADNSFDLVYGWEILHHISDPRVVITEMTRVSRRYVLAAEPNRYNPAQLAFALVDREHRWVLRYSLRYMKNMFMDCGLDVRHASVGGWIFPNVTPLWLLPVLRKPPYHWLLGISNWVLGEKR